MTEYLPSKHSRKGAVTGATDQGGRREAEPRSESPRASTAWSIPEIRVIKDDQGRLRIDQTDPATYGAYAARQFLAIAAADPSYRDVMTKRPSAPSIKITYVNIVGKRQEVGVREIFCRMDRDALVLTEFDNADGEKIKDLAITVPLLDERDNDLDDADRLHELALAELGDDVPSPPAEIESEREAPGRRRLRHGGSRLGHFGNITSRLNRLRRRARPWPHRPLSQRRAAQRCRRLSQRRRKRPLAPRPVSPCGRSTKKRRRHYVR